GGSRRAFNSAISALTAASSALSSSLIPVLHLCGLGSTQSWFAVGLRCDGHVAFAPRWAGLPWICRRRDRHGGHCYACGLVPFHALHGGQRHRPRSCEVGLQFVLLALLLRGGICRTLSQHSFVSSSCLVRNQGRFPLRLHWL